MRGGVCDMPPTSLHGDYLIAILNDVGPVIPAGMGGLVAFPETELMAWQMNQAIRLEPWECRLLRRLSREFAAMHSAASEPNCPEPWAKRGPASDAVRRHIAKGRLAWALSIQKQT